jgi:coenzyme F420-0:L-glutamate ligase / coenzyme F420-1:gamma-L-glutamate ligase
MSAGLDVRPLAPLPEVGPGDRLGELVIAAAQQGEIELADGDVVCISQKVVSKAEGRVRSLSAIDPGPRAVSLAEQINRDPRLVELILGESRRIVRAETSVLIVETRSGWICANAGIDSSNVPGDDSVLLLPEDADASARRLRDEIAGTSSGRPAVIIADSFGRPWRRGQIEVAIGCAGIDPIDDWRGRPDSEGRRLAATAIAVSDQLAGAADLVRDKTSRQPAVLIRGAERWWSAEDGPGAQALQRPADKDLFR